MFKDSKTFLGALFILILVLTCSGCTSTNDDNTTTTTGPNYKTYILSGFSFHYPKSWTVSFEKENTVIFETPNGETRIDIYDNTQYPASYESFTITDTLGNVTYKKMPDTGDGMVSYAIVRDKIDLVMTGSVEDESAHKMILESLKM